MDRDKVLKILENDDVKVADIIPYLKANSQTYHNLDKKDIEYFKSKYNQLKSKSENKIGIIQKIFLKKVLKDESLILDYLYKIKSIDILLQ